MFVALAKETKNCNRLASVHRLRFGPLIYDNCFVTSSIVNWRSRGGGSGCYKGGEGWSSQRGTLEPAAKMSIARKWLNIFSISCQAFVSVDCSLAGDTQQQLPLSRELPPTGPTSSAVASTPAVGAVVNVEDAFVLDSTYCSRWRMERRGSMQMGND